MKYLFLVISFLGFVNSHSQYLYVSSNNNDIYRFDLSGSCSASSFPNYIPTDSRIQDIAVNAFGKLYICRNDSIYLLDPANPALVFITSFAGRNIKSIEIGPEGRLYAVEKNLLRYDFNTHNLEDLGPLAIGEAGSLVFYQTRLFMSTVNSGIYAINIGDPSASKVFYDPRITALEGLVVAPARCPEANSDELRVFAFEKVGDNRSAVHMIDMEKKVIYRNYCSADIIITGNTGFHPTTVVAAQFGSLLPVVTPASCPETSDGRIDFAANAIPSTIDFYTFFFNNSPSENTTGVFTNLKSGNYQIRIQNKMGCFNDTVIAVPIVNSDCRDSIFIPTAFTPNDDGRNEIFKASSFISYTDFQMQIFNRDGQKIFQSNSMLNGWNGKIKGALSPAGVYIWLLKYKNLSDEVVYRKGFVLLLR